MGITQVLEALPDLSFEERQLLIRRLIELDDPPMSEADGALLDGRLAAYAQNSDEGSSWEEVENRIRTRLGGRHDS